MPESSSAWLRLYEPEEALDDALATRLFEAEILRPLPRRALTAPALTLPWFLEAESLRYSRQGHWIASWMEFPRHSGERVLGIGGGLGTDWVQYALNGADVTVACPDATQVGLIRANFALRRLPVRCEHASADMLPLPPCSIDVACLSGPLGAADPVPAIEEAYRVLKPGGKLLAFARSAPALDAFWRWLPGNRPSVDAVTGVLSVGSRAYRKSELAALFGRFTEPRVSRRHLRRSDLPTVLRFLPTTWLERAAGRILVFRAFKPVSAALPLQAAA